MTNGQHTKGTFLLILALLLIQLGLLLMLHQTVMLDPIVNMINNLEIVELLGVFMMLTGSVLVVISVMSLMYSIVINPIKDEIQTVRSQILQAREDRRDEISRQKLDMTSAEVRSCRFCGEPIKKGEVFCAACGKAQS